MNSFQRMAEATEQTKKDAESQFAWNKWYMVIVYVTVGAAAALFGGYKWGQSSK